MVKQEMINRVVAIFSAVCLLIGFGMSYRVMANELQKKEADTVEERLEVKVSEESRSLEENFSESPAKVESEEVLNLLDSSLEKAEESDETKIKKEVKKKKKEAEQEKKEAAPKKADKKVDNAYHIQLSEKDLTNLYRLVQSEVGYMNEKSKLLVASVVLNRVKDKQFPNNVTGVVLQKLGRVYQFSPVAPGKRFWTCTVSDSTKKAVDKVLKNGDYSKGALYFVAKAYTNKGSWFDRNLSWILHHEGQDYYK